MSEIRWKFWEKRKKPQHEVEKAWVYSCYGGHTWLHNKYPNVCPICGGSCLTQSWIEMHDPNAWWGFKHWDFPIVVVSD